MTIRPDKEIASPIQIEGLINRLEQWRSSLLGQQIKVRLHIKTPDQIDQQLIKDIRQLHVQAELADISQVEALIQALKGWLRHAPVIHLSFSSPPSPSVKLSVIEWLHQEINPDLLVDFRVDGSIAAGFVLRTKNHIYNFTANQLLWQSRHRLTELVQNV